MPCGDWRRAVLHTRIIDVSFAWQAWDSGTCPRSGHWRVDPRDRYGETCIWTLVRVRFTWQVGGKVAIGGVPNVVSRGRPGEARAQRAFRVTGVGNGATGGLAGHRFAWQAQGIVRGS